MPERIALICYSFPPHPGIGGRRWAKFTKFLSFNSYTIDVFSALNLSNEISGWEKDVQTGSVKVYPHLFQFQKILRSPENILQKIIRKAILFVSRFSVSNPSLITSYPNNSFWQKVESHIAKNSIKQLIVSGDPFLFYKAVQLKNKFDLEVTLDYRDLWNDHSFYGTHVKFTKKQKHFFEYAENFSLNHCDKLIFVDEEISKPVLKRCTNKIPPFTILHNGYDKSDFEPIDLTSRPTSDKISLFFGGNISSDLNNYFLSFFNAINDLKKKDPSTYDRFTFSFHGNFDDVLVSFCDTLRLNVNFGRAYLPVSDYLQLLANSDIGILHLSPEYKGSFATKFSDFVQLDIFTLLIGEKGSFSKLIEEQAIGLHFDPEKNENFFYELLAKYNKRGKISSALKEEFDMDRIGEQLLRFIQTPVRTTFKEIII
jgi:glycosyltransferase involved in cell wall biosynthesis